MPKLIDPPMGWRYGFPKEIPKSVLESGFSNLLEWLIDNGYPQYELDKFKEEDGSYSGFVFRILG